MTSMMLFIFGLLLILAAFTVFYAWKKHQQIRKAAEQREKKMLQELLIKKVKSE